MGSTSFVNGNSNLSMYTPYSATTYIEPSQKFARELVSSVNETSTYQTYTNKFFQEYRLQQFSNIGAVEADHRRWSEGDRIIFTLPLEEQAKYADYVCNKMCELDDLNIIKDFAMTMQIIPRSVDDPLLDKLCSSSVVGGMALMSLTLKQSFPDLSRNLEYCISVIKTLKEQRDTRP